MAGTYDRRAVDPRLELTERRLDDELRALGSVVVAFSGGVDSSLLAHAALTALGPDEVLAVTARSASLASGELEHCQSLAATWTLPWVAVDTAELGDARYRRNDGDRCRWCKEALMDAVLPLAEERGATVVLGVNCDDLGDHRPGQHAAAARGARFPMVDAGLAKSDVRAIAAARGLSVWDRPAMPCLSSRIPYGSPVTVTVLRRVDRAESVLRRLGFDDVRVRDYEDTARVEVPRDRLPEAVEQADAIVAGLEGAGYRTVTLDLAGLRSGNLNDALPSAVAS